VGHVIEAVELRRVALPLVVPFRTSFGTQTVRDALLARVLTPSAEGWGECVALAEPLYSPEFVDGAELVIGRHLLPRLWAVEHPDDVAPALAPVKGHPMAKAALELAVLDAWLRGAGKSLACHLGGVRPAVDVGVSVGIAESLEALVAQVDGYVADGYRRVKLKIEPGWDVAPVRAVRELHPGLLLQVDANGAYRLEDAAALVALDAFGLLLVEQPLAEEDLRGHAELAQRLATPICLDESVTSLARAVEAIESGACAVVNIKAGRVGGYLEAKRIHDACVERSVPVWCGGMLETGIGRGANVALASLPGFTLPGDLSASARYFHRDVTAPFELEDGRLRVPTGPGIGVAPRPERLAELTTSVELLRP
jgi:o-succinylbenzoate synthase